MNQQALVRAIGISLQQVQKNERGMSRIGAGRLQLIAQIMDVPIPYFYERASSTANNSKPIPTVVSPTAIDEFLTSRHGLDLASAYMRIRSESIRKSIVDLVEQLAQPSG
jgi:transcriptional regulator with XRE-family HTH domain